MESGISLWNEQIKIYVLINLNCCGIRNCKWNPQTLSGIHKMKAESANCKRTHLQLRNALTICGICLNIADSAHSLRIPLIVKPEQLPIFSRCRLRNKINVPTKFLLQLYVRGIYWNFASRIHLNFEKIWLETCLWNTGTYKHKIVRLSSAQFGLLVQIFDFQCTT